MTFKELFPGERFRLKGYKFLKLANTNKKQTVGFYVDEAYYIRSIHLDATVSRLNSDE